MKRYLLFVCERYYASGGWRDYQGTSDSIDELINLIKTFDHYNFHSHIVDTQTMKIVKAFNQHEEVSLEYY